MRNFILLLSLLCLASCLHEVRKSADWQSVQDEPDIVVSFLHWDSIDIRKPLIEKDLTKSTLRQRLEMLSVRKESIHVVLDKRSPPEGQWISPEEISEEFKAMGFELVSIDLASSRDSSFAISSEELGECY